MVLALKDMCGNETLAEFLSLDGAQKMVLFERSCGATTGFSTHVSLLRADAKLPNESGNLRR
jgi:hypothetical protein